MVRIAPYHNIHVERVKKLLALCDQLEGEVAQNQDNAENLMQADLREAFSQSARKILRYGLPRTTTFML